jgi:hypothetical protein
MESLKEMTDRDGVASLEVMHYAKSMHWIKGELNGRDQRIFHQHGNHMDRMSLVSWVHTQMLEAEVRARSGDPEVMREWEEPRDLYRATLYGESRVTGRDTIEVLQAKYAEKFYRMATRRG